MNALGSLPSTHTEKEMGQFDSFDESGSSLKK